MMNAVQDRASGRLVPVLHAIAVLDLKTVGWENPAA
jgi:hypothetical protein